MNILGRMAGKDYSTGSRSGRSDAGYVILMVLNVGLWIAIGVLGGVILAIFTFLFEPRGPDRGELALIVLFAAMLGGTLTGLVISGMGLKRHFSGRRSRQNQQ